MTSDRIIGEAGAARIIEQVGQAKHPLPWVFNLPCDNDHIFDLLPSLVEPPIFYWRSRNRRTEMAASGAAVTFLSRRDQPALKQALAVCAQSGQEHPIALYARRFTPSADPDQLWRLYPSEMCWIPKTAVVRKDNRLYRQHCLMVAPDSSAAELLAAAQKLAMPKICPPLDPDIGHMPSVQSVAYHPDLSGWRRNVEQVLQAIASGRIEKAVLARRTDYHFDGLLDPIMLMRRLMPHNDKTGLVLFCPSKESAFISFTPESLFRRHGGGLELEAISSTVRRGRSEADDLRQAHLLRHDEKAVREHQFVIAGITHSVSSISCAAPAVGDTDILPLDRVHHLMTPMTAELRDGVDDSMVIDHLHPTPAVGGTPTEAALRLLSTLEPFDRGWYAAPIGYTTESEAEFVVAIRSALVYGKCISVFTGAGIVAGSDPDAEWDEINAKDILQPLLRDREPR